MEYWTSKLGTKYKKSVIEKNEQTSKRELDELRKTEGNRTCADCASSHTVWASVNLGIFLCLRCGSIHRGIGTHISIPKGCTGTYLWGPDEIDRMRSYGNDRSNQIYGGGGDVRPKADERESVWRQFIIDKYEHRKFAPEIDPSIINDSELSAKVVKETQMDLLLFENLNETIQSKPTTQVDFFSQFGV
eukprot:CAMPEP_0198261036 /NCGR_PEP_ID=MMETSP1447-20131203/9842_1 /TAXON_ID=420782 /ORGANISM="Chaetoceros dichaeta, Strain CCMP1751" /LENGTH=188 /DNA_ID=CAMNT_0043948823 /DNA_START=88 /DNA_END=654 /DNA_ORIENTATION=+